MFQSPKTVRSQCIHYYYYSHHFQWNNPYLKKIIHIVDLVDKGNIKWSSEAMRSTHATSLLRATIVWQNHTNETLFTHKEYIKCVVLTIFGFIVACEFINKLSCGVIPQYQFATLIHYLLALCQVKSCTICQALKTPVFIKTFLECQTWGEQLTYFWNLWSAKI